MTASPPLPPADRFALPLTASDKRTALVAKGGLSRGPQRPLEQRGSRREIVVENARTRIVRIHLADGQGSLICKECLGPDGLARAQHETSILERLAGVPGVPELSPSSLPSWMIALRDCGDATLAAALDGPISPDRAVTLVHQLALALAGVHRRGITHRDVNPTNVMLEGPDDPVLIDFDLATIGSGEPTALGQYREIAGMLAYLAPEQTGRMGWPVDQRADLYALGVIFYQALTGCLPFPSDDPLEVIRGHLTRVPATPAVLNPDVQPILSDIVMRLLAKAPDRRYQSAEGLAHDLARVAGPTRAHALPQFPLGLRDFPQRIAGPARLIGRERELAFLREEFEAASKGDFRFVVVAGSPGVGKTALVEALHSIIVARRAWFVSAKYSRLAGARQSSNGVPLCRALMQLVLAEPEPEISEIRQRIATTLGPRARILANLVPELATLLDIEAGALPLDHAERRALVSASLADCFRAVAVPGRPVVSFGEHLQWAGAAAIAGFNAFLADERIRGFLLIASYQESEGEAGRAASTVVARLLQGRGERRLLRIGNLPVADIGTMLGDMLRLPGPDAMRLASAIHARTGGNPFHALELTNALRREGLLSPDLNGWRWDEGGIRWHAEEDDVPDLLRARLSSLPQSTRVLLAIMACLGREAEYDLLRVASDLDDHQLSEALVPALEDGLLVAASTAMSFAAARPTIRFRYDGCHEAAYRSLDPQHQAALHLTIASRLAVAGRHRSRAAEQYLPAINLIRSRDDRAEIASLLRDAATEASRAGLAQSAEPFLAAAVALLDPPPPRVSPATVAALEREWHQCLALLGRLAEADRVYAALAGRCDDPLDLVDATAAQIGLLYRQGSHREAVALGVDFMVRLGASAPGPDLKAGIADKLDQFYAWVAAGYPEPSASAENPRLLAIAKLLSRTLISAFHCDHAMTAWIMLEAQRLWTLAVPSLPLVACLSIAPHVLASLQQDYRTGYKLGSYLLGVADAHNYDTAAPAIRHRFAVYAAHWFEPLEDCARHAEIAREGLIALGDLQLACLSYHTSMVARIESSEQLDEAAAEIDKLMHLARSTGDSYAELFFQSFAELIGALQGVAAADAAAPDDRSEPAQFARTPTAAAFHHIARALQAALFDDFKTLKPHLARAWSLVAHVQGCYLVVLMHLLTALATADTLRDGESRDQEARLAELDEHHRWLELRAVDNPASFRHLAHLVAAERAWALGDTWAALSFFELALQHAAAQRRPWHTAFICERAGRFLLATGMRHSGRSLLQDACRRYSDWGATGKVRHLEQRDHIHANSSAEPQGASSGISFDRIDLLAILRASQALSSETSLHKLRLRVEEALSALTGATKVTLALYDDATRGWHLVPTEEGVAAIAIDVGAEGGLLPLSAFRYAQRNGGTTVVEDAIADDRFARDPYFANRECCSLLLMPVQSHGLVRAILILENHLTRGAFSADRLDAAALIAGQLATSLDNAMLYQQLERKVSERTEALEQANRRLAALSVTDELTGLANRRHFNEVLQAEWLRAGRHSRPVALLMIDIDFFKQYNDCYGHLEGDVCLQRVAEAMRAGARHGLDTIARYGGEEFAMVLPETTLEAAEETAARVQASIQALAHPHFASRFGHITASIGVAAITPDATTTAGQLVAAADEALYAAKGRGRNCVVAMGRLA